MRDGQTIEVEGASPTHQSKEHNRIPNRGGCVDQRSSGDRSEMRQCALSRKLGLQNQSKLAIKIQQDHELFVASKSFKALIWPDAL